MYVQITICYGDPAWDVSQRVDKGRVVMLTFPTMQCASAFPDKDDCADVICGTECIDGLFSYECKPNCPTGFEGTDCSTGMYDFLMYFLSLCDILKSCTLFRIL